MEASNESLSPDLADQKLMDQRTSFITQVNCAIEDLILKMNRKERDFKEIIHAASQFEKWLKNDKASNPIVIQCFAANPVVINALVTMIDDICTGTG